MRNYKYFGQLIVVLYVASLVTTQPSPRISPTTDLTNSQLVDAFLHKCLHSISIDLDCQPCMLCQNGAFCQQKPNPSNKPSFADTIRTHLLAHRHLTDAQHLAILRPKLDFSDLTCYCVPGYTGTYCQIDINECLSQPCSNNSTCIDGINGYECKCPPGYSGIACDVDINECDSSPCSTPGGKCVDLVDGYYCQCSPGYTGPSCAIDIDECHSQPCQHNSTCIDLINGFECNCTETGYEGALCERNIDDCADVKCQHGAACVDGVKSYKCECHSGYEGQHCEVDLNECESHPCLYGGICWQNSEPSSHVRRMQLTTNTSSSSSMVNTFEFDFSRASGYWCECEPGYAGFNCEVKINECESSPCGSNGQCIDLVNGYRCVCFNGYTGPQCTENLDECSLYHPCAPDTKCVDLKPIYTPLLSGLNLTQELETPPRLDGYYCDCSSLNEAIFKSSGNHDVIYAGLNCTTKLNACVSLKNMCQHQSICQSVLTNSSEQDIQCLCKPGYTGKYCQFATTFRMDASYSVAAGIRPTVASLFHIKFDFRVNFFHRRRRMPLVYLKDDSNSLVLAIELGQMSMRLSNPGLGLDDHLGFYYASAADSNEWSTLEILAIDARSIKILYSVKHLHLAVSKVVILGNNRTYIPTKFVLGKQYALDAMSDVDVIRSGVYTNEPYFLNSACIRDLTLNGEQLFKSESADYVNSELGEDKTTPGVKFGCNLYPEQASSQCNTVSNQSVCLHNSNCVNKWFDYECANCSLPFYGKRCQFESTKLVFLKRVTETDLKSSLELKPPPQAPNSPPPSQFQISFYIHRISTPETQHLSAQLKPSLAFLLIKPTVKQPSQFTFQYLVSIENDGYLTLKKIQTTDSSSLDQPTSRPGLNYKLIWSLKNDRVNLNDANSSYAAEISIKLVEPNLVEMAINRTYVSRFELVNEFGNQMWDIDSVKFRNFNQYVYPPATTINHGFFFNSPPSPSYYQNGFLMYDLQINGVYYIMRLKTASLIELVLMDQRLDFIEAFESTINGIGLLNRTLDDFDAIEALNQNENYCDGSSVAQASYDLLNRNRGNLTVVRNRICFQSEHFSLVDTQRYFVQSKKVSSPLIDKSGASTLTNVVGIQPPGVVNVTCELTLSRDENFFMMSSELRKIPRNYHSTCDKYGSIKKHLLHGHSTISPNKRLPPVSYINYYFDFESTQNRAGKANRTSSPKYAPVQKLTPLEWDQNTEILRPSSQQRVVLYPQDVEFYSIAFDLTLDSAKSRYESYMGPLTNDSWSDPVRANLFTLNTFDDLTTNRIFLFGLNLVMTPRTGKLELELFTSKHTIKTSDLVSINNRRTAVNLTFTFNSIELRLNGDDSYALRLTDRYFSLFFRSLLKAYGAFQINMTSFESESVPGSTHLLNSCMGNFRLATRRPSQSGFQLNHYSLIEQTKSISFFQSDYYSDLSFEASCGPSGVSGAYFYKYASGPRSIGGVSNEDNCYAVTKVDVLTSLKIDEVLDCECNSTSCSFKKWSNFSKSAIGGEDDDFESCSQLGDSACFNNGTCIDQSLSVNQSFTCQCVGSYTGNRCERFDPCIKNPCSVNSTCLPQELPNGEVTYECKCHPGFLGRNCTIKFDETCLAAPCKNGATCLNVTSIDEPQKLSYECMCTLGYEGKHCETRIDYCKLYEPCKNGATCSNQLNITTNGPITPSSFYKCQCQKGWKGPNCTQDIDECAQMQAKSIVACSGHGQCVNTMGSHKCVCDEYHYGALCEHTHICQDPSHAHPCQNGGSCAVVGDSVADNLYECKCSFGYAGVNCTYVTCDLEPCEHGSVCLMRNALEYSCNCSGTGYAGVSCETRINEFECRQEACFGNQTCHPLKCDCNSINCDEFYQQLKSKPREIIYHLILWPLLAIMVTLLIILFSIFGMKIKKSRATRGTYSPSRHEQQASRIEFSMDLKIPPEERLI